jgi:hypothetical protein
MDFTPQQLALIAKYRGINTEHYEADYLEDQYTSFLGQMVGFKVDRFYWSASYSQGDGVCFEGSEYETTQMLMWVLLPDYRIWWKALIESGLGKDYYTRRPQYWANVAIRRYTEKMGFQGEIICQQYDRYYDQLLEVLGDNIKAFMAAGFGLEELRSTVGYGSSRYYHSNTTLATTAHFDWSWHDPFDVLGSSDLEEDDLRYKVLESKTDDFEVDVRWVTEQVEDYLRSVMDDFYKDICNDLEYLDSDEAVWDTITANGLDDELEEEVA